jgi:hypothetical protein
MAKDILIRKKRLEERLAKHGIKEPNIIYLPYLKFDPTTFATPYETGCRMMIFYAIAYSASELGDRKKIIDWLKNENLWVHVSNSEQEFLQEDYPEEQKIIDFSWQGECAYILAWALNLIKESPTPTEQVNEEHLDNFMTFVPALGEKLEPFLSNLVFRDLAEIYDENLFHELATTYFRDLLFNGEKDKSDIDRGVSFLRHQALNWLRRFMGITDWDQTDTST